MWDNNVLKERAKVSFKANYWGSVVAALCVAMGAASSGGAGKNSSDAANSVSSDPIVAIATAIAIIIGVIIALAITFAIKIFVINPLVVGGYRFFAINRDEQAKLRNVLFAFNGAHYMNVVKVMFVRDISIVLWTLLFIIPGIIKGYEYRMIPFLVAENPNITVDEAFVVTKGMMTGNKLNAFFLDFSFIGWFILSAITGGILGVFYVNPYYVATCTELYFELKA